MYSALEARRDLYGKEPPEGVAQLIKDVKSAIRHGYALVYYYKADPNVIAAMQRLGYLYNAQQQYFYW